MTAISDTTRLAISVISGMAATLTLIFGFVLESNLRYWVYQAIPSLRKRGGRRPTQKPVIVWTIFWVSVTITTIGTPVASFAPKLEHNAVTMGGELNIAVATFAVNSRGSDIPQDAGQIVAQQIYLRISDGLVNRIQDNYIIHEIWPPDKTGIVPGDSPSAQSIFASQLASHINADILVYGLITGDETTQSIMPQFYVSEKSFSRIPEFVGEHLLGDVVTLTGTGDLLGRVKANRAIANRAQALTLIAIGIVSYSSEEYQQALDLFTQAAHIDAWPHDQGKETVYLLIGNAAARLDQLDEARVNFESALAINPEYARAHIGLAEVCFRHAMGNPPAQNPKDISQTDLEKAEAEFNTAISATYRPLTADIDLKVAFGLGRIALIRYEILDRADYSLLQLADEHFRSIVSAADSGNTRITELATLSHGYLGTIAFLQGNYQEAQAEYQIAIDNTSSPRVKAGFLAQLGELHSSQNEIEQAIKAYEQAVQLAPQDVRAFYQQKLEDLRNKEP